MILSVSRRTDVPRFYLDWFLNRLAAGTVLVRNPMNHSQVSRVALNEETVDCIAFWTKDPAPLLPLPPGLAPYPFFVQVTITPYGPEVESGLPDKERITEDFCRLAGAIGPHRVVWRCSPILFSPRYTMDFHKRWFEGLAGRLAGHTGRCRIGYLELYRKIAPRMRAMGLREPSEAEKLELTAFMAQAAAARGITLGGCGNLDLAAAGLEQTGCIDGATVAAAMGQAVSLGRDPGQRPTCYCVPSVDIGAYDTCLNGCAYCYANQSAARAAGRAAGYDPLAPMLCGAPRPGDKITQRAVRSLRTGQLGMY